MADNKFGFGRIKAAFFERIKPQLPKKVAQHILLFFRNNYNKQGYQDKTFTPWKARKYKVNRKLLVKTGTMRDGMYVKAQTFTNIRISNDVEYFKYHNNGTDTIPKRPMIYESAELEKEIETIIDKDINKLFR